MQASRIVLIGAGNVATHLGKGLKNAGHTIVQVYSHTQAHAQELAAQLGAQHTISIHDLAPADIYLVAVKDDAVSEIAKQLKLEGIVAHTSGSLDMSILKSISGRHGVIYPLQTFSRNKNLELSNIPFCIEASDKSTEEALAALARSLSGNIHFISSERRRTLHLAAVFASNFTNHMYTIAGDVLEKQDIPFNILLPLIEETASKVRSNSPRDAQTGPAKRLDQTIMAKHIDMLRTDDTLQAIYKLLSYSIQERK